MADTGRAALFYGPQKPFELVELPVPEPGPGCIVVKIARSNICGSELHIWRGDGRLGRLESADGRILGHEATGTVHALGDGVSTDWAGQELSIGDRVAYQYFAPCGRCRSCTRGMTEACPNAFWVQRGAIGDFPHFRGSFADYMYLYPGQAVFRVPDHVTDTMVVPINCALAQVIMGLERVRVDFGDRVVIQGAGGLGVYATAVAREMGADQVIVIDGIDERLELARQMGADELIDFRLLTDGRERVARVRELTAGWGADVVVEVVGSAGVIDEGLRMLGFGGRYLEMGTFFTGTSFPCDPGRLVGQNQRIEAVGSYNAAALRRALDFVDRNAGRLPLDEIVSDYPLEAINDAVSDQADGRVRRASLVMT
jgi:D-arabinose 1-dehydrogenase-like Zn-dependent alcohol dehydrogenase